IGARELVSAPRAPRRWTPLLAVPVPWLVWVGAMRMRLGAWPTEQSDGNLGLVPFGGAWAAAPAWSAGRWGLAAALLGGATVAIVSSRDPLLRWVLAGQLLLAATMGVFVWRQWSASGRLLLPLAVFALLALVERFGAPGMADHAPDRRPGVGTRPEIAVAAAGEVSRGSW
ncbi:MAG: hypothetical protein KDA97_09990, partial [Acidimicrobiales bacterium]|nr:hypothetical protein [Acidimicrobiales bacterium]